MQNNPNNNTEYGVINEQGFVAGNGLGFNPFDENELNPSNSDVKTEDNKNNQNDKK